MGRYGEYKMKQREHTSSGTPPKQIDHYPEIDCFIPEASVRAKHICGDESAENWSEV